MPEDLNIIRQTIATLDRSLITYLGQRAQWAYSLDQYQPGWSFPYYKEVVGQGDARTVLDQILPAAEAKYTTFALPLLCADTAPENGAVLEIDSMCIWAALLRMHTSTKLIQAKFRLGIGDLRDAVNASDPARIRQAIEATQTTDETQISQALAVATTFARRNRSPLVPLMHLPDAIEELYRSWILPQTRRLQYLWTLHYYSIPDCG
ncbi:MAG: hypothetical protein SPK06_01135 [Kiritimatiellia bacterium]|nr:hypothetical protein [Kiritimatiellia bacterium]